ncbi:MAG: arylsulfatase [Verrucomicrobiales bacterium]
MRLLFLLLGLAATVPASAAKPPNIVFILADDLGYGELGCYGQTKIPTPHLDRMAAEGARFTRHYSGAPVCAPARCTLLTGQHTGHAEIRGNRQANIDFSAFDEGQYPISDGAITIAEVMKKAGYQTAAIGKWGLGPVGSTGDPNRQGFDLFFGYNCQAVAHSFYPAHLWRNSEKVALNTPAIPGHAKQPKGEVRAEKWIGKQYAPDLMIGEAESFIARHGKEPFFLYLAFIEPHVAMHPPLDRLDGFPKEWDKTPYRGECGYLPHPRPRAAYAAMIADLDRHVGRVRVALEKQGILDDTLIVFTSDNGTTHEGKDGTNFNIGGCDAAFFNSTAGLRGYKGSVYEGGLRVPCIARWPGRIPAGSLVDVPSYFPDWFPTLAAAAVGVESPPDLDGVNLLPLLEGKVASLASRPLLWVYPEYGGQVAMLRDNMKVLRRGLRGKKPGPWEVYDLAKDSGEKNNLAETMPDLIRTAEDTLNAQMKENRLFPLALPGK